MINIIFFIALVLVIPISALLPIWFGWENGPLESAQNVLLLAGFVICLCYQKGAKGRSKKESQMWLSVGLFYLFMLARELSWGRVFFLDYIDANGPGFVRLQTLDAYPYIYAGIGFFALLMLYMLIRTIPWRELWREIPFNRLTVYILILAAAISQMAEHDFPYETHNLNQTVEEGAELLVYVIMLYLTREYYLHLKAKFERENSNQI